MTRDAWHDSGFARNWDESSNLQTNPDRLRQLTLVADLVAAANPEFLILLDYQGGDGAGGLLRFLKEHPVMSLTDAVKNERFVPLRYEELTPGPANIDAIEKIAKAMHPAAFQ